MSIHTGRAIAKARSMGGFAGEDCAAPLWDLPKRELIEIALRLTMAEDAEMAFIQVISEHACLRANRII